MSEPIYLDAHATTPVDPRVLDAMLAWMRMPANSHSAHAMGRAASLAVEEARGHVANLIGADAEEIVFVPSATIAANIALRSLARPGTSVVRSAIEHPCVIETLAALEPGISVTESDVASAWLNRSVTPVLHHPERDRCPVPRRRKHSRAGSP